MRILHVIPRYYPASGGAEIHLKAFSDRLAADGHKVTVATTDALEIESLWNPHSERIENVYDDVENVQVIRFPLRHIPYSPFSYAAVRRLLWLFSTLSAPIPILERLARLTPHVPDLWQWLQNTNVAFDLVAAMSITFESLFAAGLTFAQTHGLPFVAYPLTHLGAGRQPGQDRLSAFYTMKHQVNLILASDAVIAQTTSERAFYEARGLPTGRIPVVGPGVTPAHVLGGDAAQARLRYGLKGPVILAVGAMSYDKGTVHVVNAIRRLWEQGKAVELVLAGTILDEFRRFLKTIPAPIRDRIHVLGQVSEEEKRDLFAASDIFAMPSRTDSFGIVYLEAWLYRKPVIAARTWGIQDVVEHGIDGLLVPFADVTALAEAIDYLLTHPAEAAAMGLAGERKVYQQHTWERKYEQILNIYQQLAG